MDDSVKIAVDFLLGLMTGGILLFFLEVMHLEGSVSREFKALMSPFYHKLSKYFVFLSYVRFNLRVQPNDKQGEKFKEQIERLSRKGLEAVVSGRDISYLSADELDEVCEDINHIWYMLDRGGQLMHNIAIEDGLRKEDAQQAIKEVFPIYEGRALDVGLLYESSGKFYNVIWEPVQHCTSNYEYFCDEERKARRLILSALAFTALSVIVTMFGVVSLKPIVPCLLAIVATAIFAIALKQLSFVSSLSKRIIRSTKSEMKDSKTQLQMFWKKIIRWFESVGLALLLAAFGWQCWEEHSNQMKLEGYVYELNEKLFTVWEGVYDEALHSDRYNGKATVAVNYDALNAQMKDWQQVKKEFATLDKQSSFFFWARFVMYVLGSVFIIIAKWPRQKER